MNDGMLDDLFTYRNEAAQTMAYCTTAQLGEAATFVNACITMRILPVKNGARLNPCRDGAVLSKMYWLWVIGMYELNADTQESVDVSLHAYLDVLPGIVESFGLINEFHSYVAYGGPVSPPSL